MDRTKIKTILRWAGGALLALLSVIMLFAFIASATAKDMFGQRVYHMTAADVILMWVVILGAGAPGALLLRKAILGLKEGRAKRKDEYDDDDDDDLAEDSTDEE